MISRTQAEPVVDGAVMRAPARWWERHARLIDIGCAALLAAAIIGYLAALPLNLQSPDEARHLDHAHRVLNGERLYRDIFEITTPLWVYLMTAMFALFGTTLATARATVAVIHAGIAVVLYASCRRLGVRRELAWLTGFVAVVFSQRIFPNASYHWLATLLAVVVVLLCLQPDRTLKRAFALGVILGLLIGVHQQRGVAIALGVVAVYVVQWTIDRLQHQRVPVRTLVNQLLAIAAGGAVIAVPLFAVMIGMAGFHAVWECLITATIVNYRTAMHTWWGNAWGGRSIFISVARYSPFVLIPMAAITVALAWRQRNREAARQHEALTLLGLASLLSIAYFPDTVHLALILPVFTVMAADVIEHALQWLPARIDRAAGVVLTGALLVPVGMRAYENVTEMQARFPVPYESAFGRIDVGAKIEPSALGQWEIQYWEQLRRIVDDSPGRLLYVHPRSTYTHLMLNARNPTRYDLVLPPTYTQPWQMREVVAALAKSKVRYILWAPPSALPRRDNGDIVARFIQLHYQPTDTPPPVGQALWELKRPVDGDQ